MLRLLLAATFLIGLPFGLCSSSSSGAPSADEIKALRLALVTMGDDPNNVPPIGQDYNCEIRVAVPPTPPTTPKAIVHGSCHWAVVQQGNVWLATFRETWLCADWSVDKTNYPPCQPPSGFHEWQYQVDLAGPVQEIGESGAFAPDMA